MTAEVHCPYCNSVFAAPPGAHIGLRVTCPRCGDGFTVRALQSSAIVHSIIPATLPSDVLVSERPAAAAWRPLPAAFIEAFDVVVLTALANTLLLIDGRRDPVLQAFTLGAGALAVAAAWLRRSEFFRMVLTGRTEGTPMQPLRDALRGTVQALVWLGLLLPYLVVHGLFGYVVLTLAEGAEHLKAALVLGGVSLAAAVRVSLSLADFDQRPRVAAAWGTLTALGLGGAWLAPRWLAGVADHRYYLAYLAVCGLAIVISAHVVGALLRIRDRAQFRVAGTVVGLMGVMSLAATALALGTVEQRRLNDAGLVDKRTKRPRFGEPLAPIQPVSVVPAANLDGLRYLPSDTVIIASVRVAELLDQPGGRERLQQPLQLGPLNVPVHQLESWTGLSAQQIDHVVFAVRGGQGELLPRFVTVLRTRSAYDPEAVRRQLGDVIEDPRGRQQQVYRFRINGRPPFTEGLLRSPDAHTLLIDWQQVDLDWITAAPSADLSNLKRELREVVQQRLKPHGPVWLAGHADDWTKALRALGLLKLDKPEQELLTGLRTFVVWTPAEQKDTWMAAIRGGDAKTITQAREYLDGRLASASRKVTLVAEEEWLTVQVQPKPQSP